MNRRIAVLVLIVFLAGLAVRVEAATPPGPRLAIVLDDYPPDWTELLTVGPTGEQPEILLSSGPEQLGWLAGGRLSWSADGRRLAFGTPGEGGQPGRVLAVAREDATKIRVFPRVDLEEGDPVIAPDGRSVAFPRVKLVKVLPGRENYLFKSSIWSFDLERRSLRQVTRWRVGATLRPSSFSPDGSTLAAELLDRRGLRAVALDLHSRRLSPLARDASEATYSPDGSRLAFVRLETEHNDLPELDRPVSELWVAGADGSGAARLLRKRGFLSELSWDQSGSRLAFIYNPPGVTGNLEPEPDNKVMAINSDGTCPMTVFSNPDLTVYGAAWQPGVGREAGPISC